MRFITMLYAFDVFSVHADLLAHVQFYFLVSTLQRVDFVSVLCINIIVFVWTRTFAISTAFKYTSKTERKEA